MSRFDNIYEYDNSLNGAGLKVGIVMSRFNLPVCEGLLSACVNELKRLGVSDADMVIANVPGALEIPLVLQSMALSGKYDALVALGAVIRGDTYHFEVVSNDACRAIMEVQLHTGVPIANGVLTLGLPTAPLAIRYLLVGLVMNFAGGWSTDFITRWVEKQQGITLKTELAHH